MKRVMWVAAVLAACGHDAPPTQNAASLGGEIVARVGDETIPASLVARVAAAENTDPRTAATKLIEDALAAQGARAAGYDTGPDVKWPIVSARARYVVDRIRVDALAKGPPTNAEVDELTLRHWQTIDLPERVRVIHAVVLFPKKRSPENEQRGKDDYDALRKALDGAPDPEEFEKRVKAVPQGGSQITVERLPAFVADGRIAEGNGSLETSFARTAFSISKPGGQARAETTYGWHVVQLIERLPPYTVPFEERRSQFAEETQAMRARKAYEALLARLRAAHPVEISTAAENLMKSLSVDGS